MCKYVLKISFCLTLVMTLFLAFTLPVLADKPPWAGNQGGSSKNSKKDKSGKTENTQKGETMLSVFFTTEQRKIIRNYYSQEYHRGHCPPGLAKKKNGCMPPGQAKKWRQGSPLPGDVVYYDLPTSIIRQLGRPPEGHRYIRVAGDILLIAIGTRIIVDAIQDLNSL